MISELPPLVLASSSPYRAELLRRLGLAFSTDSPAIDESLAPDERVPAACLRLAAAKAAAVAERQPSALILASDQLAELNGKPLGKPGHREAAARQLRQLSGATVRFHTAVCLYHDANSRTRLDETQVRFRRLTDAEIERYLRAEPAFDCAGSFKSEGLGISLTEHIDSQDPTALIGLPLIATAALLRQAGYRLP